MVEVVWGCHGGGACDDAGAMGVAIRGGGISGLTCPTLDIGFDINGGGRAGGP